MTSPSVVPHLIADVTGPRAAMAATTFSGLCS
jgi:hypothetical protein